MGLGHALLGLEGLFLVLAVPRRIPRCAGLRKVPRRSPWRRRWGGEEKKKKRSKKRHFAAL